MKIMASVGCVVAVLVSLVSVSNLNAENVESFDLVWQMVNEHYYDPAFGGLDWEAAYQRYRPQIVKAKGIEAFTLLTNQMLFELKTSHLLVASERMLKTYIPTLFSEGTLGIEIRWLQNKAVITKVNAEMPGYVAGLKPGYIITRIDGQQINDIIRRAEVLPPYNVRNFSGGVANFVMGHINGPPNTPVTLTCQDQTDRLWEATLVRQGRGTGQTISEALPPFFVEFETRRLAGNIGYIGFNHFASPVDTAFVDALQTMRDTEGLIFDVRGNPGGYFKIMDTIIAQLITQKTLLYRFRFRDQTVERIINPSQHPYQQPVAVLIDVTSTSASEHFAACLQAIGRGVIIGERSPGYLLGARWIRLPNRLSFMYAFVQPIPSNGRIIEGHGVKPNIKAVLNRKDLLLGQDNQLAAAIAYIRGSKKGGT